MGYFGRNGYYAYALWVLSQDSDLYWQVEWGVYFRKVFPNLRTVFVSNLAFLVYLRGLIRGLIHTLLNGYESWGHYLYWPLCEDWG